jgi:hypothetical protein
MVRVIEYHLEDIAHAEPLAPIHIEKAIRIVK